MEKQQRYMEHQLETGSVLLIGRLDEELQTNMEATIEEG